MNQDLLEKAISGDAESQYQLALCYRNGEGVEQSNEEAAKWYRKSSHMKKPRNGIVLQLSKAIQ